MGKIDKALLQKLKTNYAAASDIYHATRYWQNHIDQIEPELMKVDLDELESGKYPILATFGFGAPPYRQPVGRPSFRPASYRRHLIRQLASRMLGKGQDWFLPHDMKMVDIYTLAFNKSQLIAKQSGSVAPETLSASTFGNPADLFYVDGKPYTTRFLDYYCRYCFANGVLQLTGQEVIVEIGSGSGKQTEVLKKVMPNGTFVCFDLPLQLYLAYEYLSGVFGDDVVPLSETMAWDKTRPLTPGKIYLFGNWQTPLLRDMAFDVFWNAASFGEMEPAVVKNYLAHVGSTPEWVYLMQARHGKESGLRQGGVIDPQDFEAYNAYLSDYELVAQQDNQASLYPLRESGGYFDAVWKRK